MYDELVATLRRQCIEMDCGNCNTCVKRKAADAIEELSVVVRAQKAVLDKFPKWIPVTKRLPEEGRYLALTTPCINGGEPYARILRFSKNLESVDRYDFDGINRSGWYYFDDEYGYLEVDTVTHWMPLPEPPKEGE